MGLKELLAKHGVENATLESEISALITAAEQNNTGIPKSRFDAVIAERNELRADKAELESKIAELTGNIETLKTDNQTLRAIEKEYNDVKASRQKAELEKWNKRKEILNISEADPNFDKIQKVIGKFIMEDDLTPEQVRSNNNLFETYEEIDYFGKDTNTHPDGKKPGSAGSQKLNPFDMVNGRIRDMREANRIYKTDPALAEKLRASAVEFKE